MTAVTSPVIVCHCAHVFRVFHIQYEPVSEGTRYALCEKVRFLEPSRYGASCVDVHEASLKPLASAPGCVPTMIVLSCAETSCMWNSSPIHPPSAEPIRGQSTK